MLKKSLVFILVCFILLCCVCCSNSSGSDPVEETWLVDIRYEVPSSWTADLADIDVEKPVLSNIYTSEDDGVAFVATRYLGPDDEHQDPAAELETKGIEYEEVSAATHDGTISGVSYVNEDGYREEVYEIVATSGDIYRLSFALLSDAGTAKKDAVMSSVHLI